MKNSLKRLLSLILSVMLLFLSISCKNSFSKTEDPNLKFFGENPTTITWANKEESTINSFQADVEVYSNNNRRDSGAQLSNKYRMSLKTINEIEHIRLDFDPEFSNSRARSVLSNDKEIILFDPDTDEIVYRFANTETYSTELKTFFNDSMLSRINLPEIKKKPIG